VKIICDIDSTITDHWRRIRRWTKPHWPGGRCSSEAFTRDEVMKDLMLPDCREVLWDLSNRYEIGYLTARGWPRGLQVTLEQLDGFDLPNPKEVTVVASIGDKVAVLRDNPCAVYIDDFMTGQENAIGTFRRRVAEAIEEMGIFVIPFRNDWLDVREQIRYWEESKSCES